MYGAAHVCILMCVSFGLFLNTNPEGFPQKIRAALEVGLILLAESEVIKPSTVMDQLKNTIILCVTEVLKPECVPIAQAN